jgi:hypothetical protein
LFADIYKEHIYKCTNDEIFFKDYFNEFIKDKLSSCIIKISYGKYFNNDISHLPSQLKYLTFGRDFNQNINTLPKTVTHLTFGTHFDKSVDKPSG